VHHGRDVGRLVDRLELEGFDLRAPGTVSSCPCLSAAAKKRESVRTLTECPWFARIHSSSAPSSPVGSALIEKRCLALSRTMRSSVSRSQPLSFGRFICCAGQASARLSRAAESGRGTHQVVDTDKAIRAEREPLLARAVAQDVAQGLAPARVGVVCRPAAGVLGRFRGGRSWRRRGVGSRRDGCGGGLGGHDEGLWWCLC